MLVNQTGGENNRRLLRTNTDSSPIKKSKKQREDLSNENQRKLRSSNNDNKSHRRQILSTKKERKKRMKKILDHSEPEITITQTTKPKTNSLDTFEIKQEDDCPLLSHSIFDHNQFWHSNQILTPTGYYLPVNSSPYDHQSNPSDMDNSNSPIHENTSKSNNNCGQSRKDKSLGLLCQR
jgi:hypothetical protein